MLGVELLSFGFLAERAVDVTFQMFKVGRRDTPRVFSVAFIQRLDRTLAVLTNEQSWNGLTGCFE